MVRRGTFRLASVVSAALFWLTLAPPGSAADGVLEINQTCAVNTGCFQGDTPGFPIDVTQPGSYVFTGDIDHDPAVHGTTEIVRLLADDVSLDLRGFSIRSTSTCQSGDCVIGTVDGIDSSTADRAMIRNGRVVGVDGNCIRVAAEAHVENVTVSHCGALGISVGANSIVLDSRITSTGRTGLHSNAFAAPPGTLYRGCTFASNGVRGEAILPDMSASVSRTAKAAGPNFCEDRLCGQGRRLYYLSQTDHFGDQALGACDPGFHMASLFEIFNWSVLEYDTRRGLMRFDSGAGPPQEFGWVRTGGVGAVAGGGSVNCDGWRRRTVGDLGMVVSPEMDWRSPADHSISPWDVFDGLCAVARPVWCIED